MLQDSTYYKQVLKDAKGHGAWDPSAQGVKIGDLYTGSSEGLKYVVRDVLPIVGTDRIVHLYVFQRTELIDMASYWVSDLLDSVHV